jgi:tRNA(His) guanylyltransferase
MTDRSALGDRMKRYEAPFRQLLPRRTYTVLRLDGRAFHTYLRGCDRPYDEQFMADMDAVAEALCKEITGTQFAYTQSDEISLITDFAGIGTEPWFGGVAAKVLSISAALAAAVLNHRRPWTGGPMPLFDARVFALSDPVEVANYFVWRQRDAVRNSITMTAQTHFSHKQLHGVKGNELLQMLIEKGVDWTAVPDGFRRGRLTEKEYGPRPGPGPVVLRSWWDTSPAPQFVAQSGSDLSRRIPSLPTFVAVDDD